MDRLSFLDPQIFQNICEQIAAAIGYNINVMNASGIIIASSNKVRIGEQHYGALKVMRGEVDFFAVDGATAKAHDVYEGYNLPLEYQGDRIANIGVTAPLEEARRYAEVVRICVNAILRDIGREIEHKAVLESEVRKRTAELEKEILRHKQTESELILSRERLNDTLMSSSDWLWETDADNRYVYLSETFYDVVGLKPEEVLGRTRDEVIGKLLLSTNRNQWEEISQLQKERRGFRNLCYEIKTPADETLIIEVSAKPFFDSEGNLRGYRGTGADVTREKIMEEALKQSEKMAGLGEMVAGVAHEVNTPLGVCVTVASHLEEELKSLQERYQSGAMGRTHLENYLQEAFQSYDIIKNNLNRAAGLIRSFKQIAVDQSSEHPRLFDFGLYIGEVLTSLGPKLSKTNFNTVVNCPDNLKIKARPDLFAHIITNFVVNSLTHGFENQSHGAITLCVLPKGTESLVLVYKDDGKGMDAESRKRIYEPFYTTKRGVGSGLGMHIIFNIVTEQLGGTIECSSSPGQGVRFEIEIPQRQGTLEVI